MIISREHDTGMRHHYVPCECKSMDHTFCFVYFVDKEDMIEMDPYSQELYLEVQMTNYKSFFKRAWAGLKYIFGYTSVYGHWDSASISRYEAQRIVDLMNKFIDETDPAIRAVMQARKAEKEKNESDTNGKV